MNINFNKLFQLLRPFIYIVLFAYLLGVALFFYLPKDGVSFLESSNSTLEYKKYDFYSSTKKTENKNFEQENKQIFDLSKYELKAVYYKNSSNGWVTIEDKATKESHILKTSEQIDGYVLSQIFRTYVLFKKDKKDYKLELNQNEIKNYDMNQNTNQEIKTRDNGAVVSREYLNSYINNIEKIWNNIAIKEIKKGDKIDGFKIEKINKSSVFAKLGLKEGDIIKSVNNSPLESYADAFKVYNNMGNTKYLNMEVLRNNEIVELNYEIN